MGQTISQNSEEDPAYVTTWADASGGGHDLIQATDGRKPFASSNGVLVFSKAGSGSYIKTAAFTLTQPYTIYARFRQRAWESGDYLVDGNTVNTGVIGQTSSTPSLGLYAGLGFTAINSAATLNTWASMAAVFNGASSALQIGSTTQTGNAGSNNMGGLTLGSGGSGGLAQCSDVDFAEVIVYSVAHDATQRAEIIAYLDTINPEDVPTPVDNNVYYQIYGDSISIQNGHLGNLTTWPYLLAQSGEVGIALNNAASGAQANDMQTIYTRPDAPSLIVIGTNDQRSGGYGANATKRAQWKRFILGALAWRACTTKTKATSASASGTWSNSVVFGARQSSTSGSTMTFTTNGDVAYLWTVIQDSQSGTWKVTEGGVEKASGTTAPDATVLSTTYKNNFGAVLTRISGLGAGSHTLVFEVTNSALVYCIGMAGIDAQTSPNNVWSANVMSPNETGFAGQGVDESNVQAYCDDHADAVATLAADGLPVYEVDLHALTISYMADGLHPDQTGQQQIADAFAAAMGI